MRHAPLAKYHLPTILTWQRIDARHDRRWHDAPANDRFESDVTYFARLAAAMRHQMRGDD